MMVGHKKKSNLGKKYGAGRSSANGGNLLYVFGAVVALGMLGAGFYWVNATQSEMAVDPDTLCPVAGPVAATVVLLDVTDPLSLAQSN